MTTQHTEMVSFFLDASKALDENPRLAERIQELEATIEALKAGIASKDQAIDNYASRIHSLEDKVRETEQKLDDASFRELQARDSFESLVKAVRGAADMANKADQELNPPKPVPFEAPASTADTSTSGMTTQPNDTSDSDTQIDNLSSGQSESHPTVSLTADQSLPVEQSDTTKQDAGQAAGTQPNVSLPKYVGQPYWTKPNTMTWRQWQSDGGNVPGWVADLDAI